MKYRKREKNFQDEDESGSPTRRDTDLHIDGYQSWWK